jgi:hypothetical protein
MLVCLAKVGTFGGSLLSSVLAADEVILNSFWVGAVSVFVELYYLRN